MSDRIPRPRPRLRRPAVAVAAATALACFGLTGTGLARTARAAHAAGRTVHVIEHADTDAEAPGVGGTDVKGNIRTFNTPIFNAANARQVGRDEGFCTRLEPKLGIWECLWTTFLAGGQITVQGPFYDTRNSVMSITGGTGAYRNARGQMKLVSRNGGKAYDFIFELSPS